MFTSHLVSAFLDEMEKISSEYGATAYPSGTVAHRAAIVYPEVVVRPKAPPPGTSPSPKPGMLAGKGRVLGRLAGAGTLGLAGYGLYRGLTG